MIINETTICLIKKMEKISKKDEVFGLTTLYISKRKNLRGRMEVLLIMEKVKMPEIPMAFIRHSQVRHVLSHTVERFDFEEQIAIYLYCILELPIDEIAISTELSENHIVSVLTLYVERLSFKLDLFKKAVPYNADELAHISEMLVSEV